MGAAKARALSVSSEVHKQKHNRSGKRKVTTTAKRELRKGIEVRHYGNERTKAEKCSIISNGTCLKTDDRRRLTGGRTQVHLEPIDSNGKLGYVRFDCWRAEAKQSKASVH